MTKVNCKDCTQSDCVYFGLNNNTSCKDFTAKEESRLTDDEIEQVFKESAGYGGDDFRSFARAIEAKLMEKAA